MSGSELSPIKGYPTTANARGGSTLTKRMSARATCSKEPRTKQQTNQPEVEDEAKGSWPRVPKPQMHGGVGHAVHEKVFRFYRVEVSKPILFSTCVLEELPREACRQGDRHAVGAQHDNVNIHPDKHEAAVF